MGKRDLLTGFMLQNIKGDSSKKKVPPPTMNQV